MKRLALSTALAGPLASISWAVGSGLPTVPTPTPEPALSSGLGGLLQAGLGLALVLALIFLCAWALRRFGLQPADSNRLLKVVASVMVGQRERVVVVEVGGSWLVLGVAAGQVSALHTMPAEHGAAKRVASGDSATPGTTAFSQALRDSLAHFGKARKTP